jgi:hypothetical protein
MTHAANQSAVADSASPIAFSFSSDLQQIRTQIEHTTYEYDREKLQVTLGKVFAPLTSLVGLVFIALLFPLAILGLGLPVALLVRLVLEIAQRL